MNYQLKDVVTDNDIQELESLARDIWEQHFTSIIGKAQVDYMLEKFQSFAPIKQQIADGMIYKMLNFTGKNTAYCGFKKDGNRVFLSKLYVKREHRGNGLARAMMNIIRDFAVENDLKSVYLTVNKYNNDTIAIYKHWGFETTESVVTDIGNGFVMDDYIMQLEI